MQTSLRNYCINIFMLVENTAVVYRLLRDNTLHKLATRREKSNCGQKRSVFVEFPQLRWYLV